MLGKQGDSSVVNRLLQIIQDRSDQDFRFPIRASALTVLGRLPQDTQTTETILAACLFAMEDPKPQIRFSAIGALGTLPDDIKLKHLPAMLHDPNLAVRTESARLLARLHTQLPKGETATRFEYVKEEYRTVQYVDNDQPMIYLNLAVLEHDLVSAKLDEVNRWLYASAQSLSLQSAEFTEAKRTAMDLIWRLTAKPLELYRQSLKIDSQFVPSKINLAMLHNERGEFDLAEQQFREALKIEPLNGEIAYSLGLLLAELEKIEESVDMLRLASENFGTAADRQATRSRVRYNLGLLLMQLGRIEESERELVSVVQIEPENLDFLYALLSLYMQQNEKSKAQALLDRLIKIQPDNTRWQQMKTMLR